MKEIKSVCVYCGHRSTDEKFRALAVGTGEIIAANGFNLVYGGGSVGLMGEVANAAMKNDGYVVGIIPEHILEREAKHDGLSELHVVQSMHERKHMMVEKSDAFIILPGGFGTLDEFFEIMTWKQLGLHKKPIILVNGHDYWAPILNMVETMLDKGFAYEGDDALFSVVSKPDEILPILQNTEISEEPDKLDKL